LRPSAALLRAEQTVAGIAQAGDDVAVVVELLIDRGAGPIPATLLRPPKPGPHPAILSCHAHGNAWDIGRRELIAGRPALPAGPYGPDLVRLGHAVLCLDMPGHGARVADGSESALSKAALWQGRTLMGEMLADLRAGLDVLTRDPAVDKSRIGALGLSMGGTHAYWIAALDERIAAVAHLCVLADIGPLIATRAQDLHGAYLTVPGLLEEGDMGDVAGLGAPRPHFVALGGQDPLTPEAARVSALDRLRKAYEAEGAEDRLQTFISPATGHVETTGMRAALLAFLHAALSAPSEPQ